MNISRILLSLVIVSFVFSDGHLDGDLSVNSTGAVDFICSWNGSGDATLTPGDFGEMDIATYDVVDDGLGAGADVISFDDIVSVADFDANYAVEITATKGTWTLPTNYNETAGTSKRTDGSDSNFFIKAEVTDQGSANTPSDGGLVEFGGYDSYQALPTTGAIVIKGGSTATNDAHGVENAIFNIDARVAMDWVYDIKGTYTINLLLTVASQ